MKITNFRPEPQGSKYIAMFDIEIMYQLSPTEMSMMTLHDWRCMYNKKGYIFAFGSSKKATVETGASIYLPYITFESKDFLTQVHNQLKDLIKAPGSSAAPSSVCSVGLDAKMPWAGEPAAKETEFMDF